MFLFETHIPRDKMSTMLKKKKPATGSMTILELIEGLKKCLRNGLASRVVSRTCYARTLAVRRRDTFSELKKLLDGMKTKKSADFM